VICDLEIERWRGCDFDFQQVQTANFIDGDLVEQFLDLKAETKEKVASSLSIPVADLTQRIEELSTSLH